MADVLRKYAQIRRNGNVVCLVGDESLGMPITESHCVYTVDLKGHPQQNEVEENMIYNPKTDTFSWGRIVYEPEPNLYTVQEITAFSAERKETTIALDVPAAPATGTIVKFKAPCACSGVTTLHISGNDYVLVDADGNIITDIPGNVFVAGAMVAVLIDNETSQAFIQNAAINTKYSKELEIPFDGWFLDETTGFYKLNIEDAEVTENSVVNINLDLASLEVAEYYGVKPVTESYGGGFSIYADDVPEIAMVGTMIVL